MIAVISVIMIVCGLLFFLASVVGILRFPDFYTRMHAAGKGDTLSTILVTGGIALYYVDHNNWEWSAILVGLKIFAIVIFIFIASPTSTHVLMRAGFDSGVEPVRKNHPNPKDPGES